MARDLDIVVYGATGFTGRLVAEYLAHHYKGRKDAPKWAIVRSRFGKERPWSLVMSDPVLWTGLLSG